MSTKRMADPVVVIWARAEVRCYLVREGEIEDPVAYFLEFLRDAASQVHSGRLDLIEAVDACQAFALHAGFVAAVGQDLIQECLAEAFAAPLAVAVAA